MVASLGGVRWGAGPEAVVLPRDFRELRSGDPLENLSDDHTAENQLDVIIDTQAGPVALVDVRLAHLSPQARLTDLQVPGDLADRLLPQARKVNAR